MKMMAMFGVDKEITYVCDLLRERLIMFDLPISSYDRRVIAKPGKSSRKSISKRNNCAYQDVRE